MGGGGPRPQHRPEGSTGHVPPRVREGRDLTTFPLGLSPTPIPTPGHPRADPRLRSLPGFPRDHTPVGAPKREQALSVGPRVAGHGPQCADETLDT